MRTILALDQSTSATKALLFDEQGALLDKTEVPHTQIYPRPGWVEHDAQEIYRNTLQAVQSLLDRTTQAASPLCLSITNQRETVVVFDRTTGEPLSNAIVWQCRRGEPICNDIVKAGYGDWIRQVTGLTIDTYFSASKIRWLVENRPDIGQRLLDSSALVGTIDAYLVYRLTGGAVFATDTTNASRTLLFDIGKLRWDENLCDLFGVPIKALPEVRESKAHFGQTTLEGLLPVAIPICGVMADSQAALFAQRCFTPNSGKVTLGSGSSVLVNIGHQVQYSSGGNVTALAWVDSGKPAYAFEGIINYTGATIAWLQEQLKLISSPDEADAMARAVSDNGGVYLIPAFVGLSAPYWQPTARAGILGLTPSSTRNHIARAALEAIAYLIQDVLASMASDTGIALSVIHADGGMVKNKFLMQFIADICQLTVRASDKPELSPFGAVLSGLIGMGVYNSAADLARVPHAYVDYYPHMDVTQARQYCAEWHRAVEQILSAPSR